ncbi:DUF6049 family protein [Cellulomonas sp. KRMCY2]|uniref:DUF6049 family protein n=1 Tax=Cellulomonas sp. KRMCY2 TaxID=1304865 RepID=UPI00045EB757|nr:DUF6049 family protein [Cellulomonas sp. KRMCY2]
MTAHAEGTAVAPRALRRGLVGLALALGLVASMPSAAGAAAAVPDAALPVEVDIATVTPQVLQPGENLTVTATLRNNGTTTIAEPRVVVHLDRDPFISRSSLDTWRDADPQADLGSSVLEVDLPSPLPPGGIQTVTATVPAGSVGLRSAATAWGPRGLALSVVDRADPARVRQGVARTFALWFPQQDVTATRLSILVPVVGPPVDPLTGTWGQSFETLTQAGGRLAALLSATQTHPGVTWLLDPWLVDITASDAADPDAPIAGGLVGPNAKAWSAGLLAATTDREVRLLPYGDADVAALAHANAHDLFTDAIRRSEAVASAADLPGSATTAIALPAESLPDLVTAAFVADDGGRALVVGPGELPAPSVLTYTPSGRTTVSTPGDDVTVLVPDERLSTALETGVVRGRSDEQDATDPQLTPTTAALDLLAELAVITRERPNDGRHLLLTVPRDWQPDATIASAQLTALENAPWVRAESIDALVGASDTGVDRGTLPERDVDPAEMPPSEMAAMLAAVTDRQALAQVAQDPAALLGDLDAELFAPVSVAWRADPPGRASVVSRSSAISQSLRGAVTVQPIGFINLISRSGELPVQVTNTLDQPVTVVVALRPSDGRLVADEPVTVTIPAGVEQTVQIPVHAIQSADLGVVVELRTVQGTVINDQTAFTVRVRAEWEGIGTAVIGALLALGVVIGLIRTIRRGRRGTRSAPRLDAGPDALSPEEGHEPADQAPAAGSPA